MDAGRRGVRRPPCSRRTESSRNDPHGVDCIYARDHPGEHRDAEDVVDDNCRQFAMLAFLASNAVSSIAVLDAVGRAKKHGQLDVQQEYREDFLRHEQRNPEAELEDFAPARRESGNGDHFDHVERWKSRRVQLRFVEMKSARGQSGSTEDGSGRGLSDAGSGCVNSLLSLFNMAVECETGRMWMSAGGW
jgi:hypothetical protein